MDFDAFLYLQDVSWFADAWNYTASCAQGVVCEGGRVRALYVCVYVSELCVRMYVCAW